jgi:hypothetical protein
MSRTPTNAQSAMYEGRWKDCREKLKVALQERDEARAELAEAHKYAERLATLLCEKHFKDVAPRFKLLPDTVGIITQIDNMTCGIDEKAEARGYERGVREAAVVCDRCPDSHWGPWIHKRILALLEPVTLQEPEA